MLASCKWEDKSHDVFYGNKDIFCNNLDLNHRLIPQKSKMILPSTSKSLNFE